MSMIEIQPISPSYPVQPTKKVIRDEKNKQQPDNPQPEKQKQDEDEASTELPSQHIDEIV